MKITIYWLPANKPATSPLSSLVLADSPGNIPMRGFSVNGTRVIQQENVLRALDAVFSDRGNKRVSIDFETTRIWGNQSAAEDYVLLHDETFPGIFSATMITGPGAGASTTRMFPVMTCQSVASRVEGCTTVHTYRLMGQSSSIATM